MSNRDHPRVCGEKLFQSPLLRLPLGSSPRMRGKDVRQELQHSGRGITPLRVRGKVLKELIALLFHGITPACAGKSVRRENSSS